MYAGFARLGIRDNRLINIFVNLATVGIGRQSQFGSRRAR